MAGAVLSAPQAASPLPSGESSSFVVVQSTDHERLSIASRPLAPCRSSGFSPLPSGGGALRDGPSTCFEVGTVRVWPKARGRVLWERRRVPLDTTQRRRSEYTPVWPAHRIALTLHSLLPSYPVLSDVAS
jgi:hypothetical protein